MTQNEALKAVRQYDGKSLQDIGTVVESETYYNNPVYTLPNGMKVRERFDEFYEQGDVYLLSDGGEIYVGVTDGESVWTVTDVIYS